MNTEQRQVREFMEAAQQALPSQPTVPSLEVRMLRASLMLEECIETIRDGLGLDIFIKAPTDHGARLEDVLLAQEAGLWFELHSGDLVCIADGCADTKVVTDGTALACGIDLEPVFAEVHRSNMSKFIDGTFREDGKYVKGPSYSRAAIKPILIQQGLK